MRVLYIMINNRPFSYSHKLQNAMCTPLHQSIQTCTDSLYIQKPNLMIFIYMYNVYNSILLIFLHRFHLQVTGKKDVIYKELDL